MMIDMEKPSRDFKGIWIPKEIWLSDQLSLMEKILLVEIHSLDNERGVLQPTNTSPTFSVCIRAGSPATSLP